jgi:hypothetical protein
MRELNPVIETEVLKWEQSYSYAKVEFRLTNRSKAHLSYVAVALDAYTSKGEYLGNDYINETNCRAGQSLVKEINLKNVKVGEIASWKMTLKDVTIDRGNSQIFDAKEFFLLKETLVGADRKHQKRLEDYLNGRWRERLSDQSVSSSEFYFSSTKPEVIWVDNKGKEDRFSVEILERNYSSGKLRLRFAKPQNGLQFDIAQVDGRTICMTFTHSSKDGVNYEEVSRYDCVCVYVGKKERP